MVINDFGHLDSQDKNDEGRKTGLKMLSNEKLCDAKMIEKPLMMNFMNINICVKRLKVTLSNRELVLRIRPD